MCTQASSHTPLDASSRDGQVGHDKGLPKRMSAAHVAGIGHWVLSRSRARQNHSPFSIVSVGAPHDLPTASKLCGGHVIDAWSAKTATRWLVKAQIFPLGCEARPQTGLVFERMLGVRRGSAIAQLTGQSHLAGGGAVSSRTALPG